MDNKKLLQILLRDVTELEELVTGIKKAGSWEPLEMELLTTRIAGVRHMLEMVASAEVPVKNISGAVSVAAETIQIPDKEITVKPATHANMSAQISDEPAQTFAPVNADDVRPAGNPDLLQEDNMAGSVPVDRDAKETPVAPRETVTVENRFKEDKEPGEAKEVSVSGPGKEKISGDRTESAVQKPVERTEVISSDTESEIPSDDDMQFEEDEAVPGPKTLGEKFVHGRSVNDLLLEHGKTDSRFSNMPVPSLQTAIGINDRFLFTRELFEGNGDAFTEAIRKIDSMGSIHDAAVFLRENFKWKKNETSLKFIELVKRRFA